MKKYFTLLLTICLMMQFSGCYSFRDITLDELQIYSGLEDVRIKTNQDEIIINRKSTSENSSNWETGDSSIIIKSTELIRDNGNAESLVKNSEIKYHQIEKIEIEEFDNLKTIGLTLGIILATALIIAAATFDLGLDFSGTTLTGW